MSEEIATLAGGCFWCLEAAFERLRGVRGVVSGFSGGSSRTVTYREVCELDTGHAEVVQVRFDPEVLPYEALLDVFFSIHDPTTRDRQGNDVGPQYRSAIFHHSEAQRAAARATIARLEAERTWDGPVVTEVVPFEHFVPAGPEHQAYYRRNPGQGYCRAVISPKLAKLRARWADRLAPETAERPA